MLVPFFRLHALALLARFDRERSKLLSSAGVASTPYCRKQSILEGVREDLLLRFSRHLSGYLDELLQSLFWQVNQLLIDAAAVSSSTATVT
ncbi:MAG: hypothetical protein QW291_09430 [Thermofilaceae archaeon]